MKTDINTQLVKDLLNSSILQLAQDTLGKLRAARSRALDHQRTRSTVPVLAWLGHHGERNDSFHMSNSMSWAVAALFVACLISGATFWQNYSSEHEICDVDIAILTDDLPIHVYLD
jgi:hypothetical protein